MSPVPVPDGDYDIVHKYPAAHMSVLRQFSRARFPCGGFGCSLASKEMIKQLPGDKSRGTLLICLRSEIKLRNLSVYIRTCSL